MPPQTLPSIGFTMRVHGFFFCFRYKQNMFNHFNERFWNPGLAFYNQPLSIQKKHLSSVQPLYLFLRSVVSKGCIENENYFNFFLAGG